MRHLSQPSCKTRQLLSRVEYGPNANSSSQSSGSTFAKSTSWTFSDRTNFPRAVLNSPAGSAVVQATSIARTLASAMALAKFRMDRIEI